MGSVNDFTDACPLVFINNFSAIPGGKSPMTEPEKDQAVTDVSGSSRNSTSSTG